jgi:hypothetical protein
MGTERALALLPRAAEDPDWRVRYNGLAAYLEAVPGEALPLVARAIRGDPEASARGELLRRIAGHQERAPQLVDGLLLRALLDRAPPVRALAHALLVEFAGRDLGFLPGANAAVLLWSQSLWRRELLLLRAARATGLPAAELAPGWERARSACVALLHEYGRLAQALVRFRPAAQPEAAGGLGGALAAPGGRASLLCRNRLPFDAWQGIVWTLRRWGGRPYADLLAAPEAILFADGAQPGERRAGPH